LGSNTRLRAIYFSAPAGPLSRDRRIEDKIPLELKASDPRSRHLFRHSQKGHRELMVRANYAERTKQHLILKVNRFKATKKLISLAPVNISGLPDTL